MSNFTNYKQYTADVKNYMTDALSYKSGHVRDIVKNIPFAKGKMIRAILLFASASMSGELDQEKYEKCVKFASIIELLHLATLVHDDVIDDSDMRRGSESVNSSHTNRIAILMGDIIFSTSFRLMAGTKNSMEILQIISAACEDLVCGEIEEEILVSNVQTSKVEYIDIIYKKTGRLFEAAAKVGAYISNPILVEDAGLIGKNLGIAFQVIDDKIDYFSSSKNTGKPALSDIKSKKFTLPMILLREVSSGDEFHDLEEYFSTSGKELDIDGVLNLMKKHSIQKKIQIEANEYLDLVDNCLMKFGDCDSKSRLKKLLIELKGDGE